MDVSNMQQDNFLQAIGGRWVSLAIFVAILSLFGELMDANYGVEGIFPIFWTLLLKQSSPSPSTQTGNGLGMGEQSLPDIQTTPTMETAMWVL
jgi:hypothetical protein